MRCADRRLRQCGLRWPSGLNGEPSRLVNELILLDVHHHFAQVGLRPLHARGQPLASRHRFGADRTDAVTSLLCLRLSFRTELVVEVELIEHLVLHIVLVSIVSVVSIARLNGALVLSGDTDVVDGRRPPSRTLPSQLNEALGLQLAVQRRDLITARLPYLLGSGQVVKRPDSDDH